MSNEYIGVVTLAGQAAIAGSIGGTPLSLTTVRVGDGNGLPITPNETMTDLVRRVGTAYGIAASGRDPVNPTMWRITAVIPAADGPFDIREIGVFDAGGTLIALAKHPFVEKRSPAQGNAVELTTDIVFPIWDTAQVTINLLPDVAVHIGQMLRAPFLVVDSATTTAPPTSPALGATYVIPAAGATGAWAGAGLANRMAQWTGEVWAAVDVPVGHLVVARDKGLSDPLRYLSRTATGWGPDLPIAIRAGAWNYAAASGSASALSITLNPAPSAWSDLVGTPLRLLMSAAAGTPTTLAVAGLSGTRPIVKRGGAPVLTNEWLAGDIVECVYDGTVMRMVSSQRLGLDTGGFSSYGTNVSIPASDIGKAVNLNLACRSVILPRASDCAGGIMILHNTTPGYMVTVSVQGGDEITIGDWGAGGGHTSFALAHGESALIGSWSPYTDGWAVMAGSAHDRYTPQLFSALSSAVGGASYKRIPDQTSPTGYITIQSGSKTVAVAQTMEQVVFPIAFANRLLGIYASSADLNGYAGATNNANSVVDARVYHSNAGGTLWWWAWGY